MKTVWLKHTIVLLLSTTVLFSSMAQADCDFSKGITDNGNGTYTYTKECNRAVGRLVFDNQDLQTENAALKRVITLKDLTITTESQRADLWMNTALKLEDKVNTIDRMNETNKWVNFGLGVVVTGLAVWGAGRLR